MLLVVLLLKRWAALLNGLHLVFDSSCIVNSYLEKLFWLQCFLFPLCIWISREGRAQTTTAWFNSVVAQSFPSMIMVITGLWLSSNMAALDFFFFFWIEMFRRHNELYCWLITTTMIGQICEFCTAMFHNLSSTIFLWLVPLEYSFTSIFISWQEKPKESVSKSQKIKILPNNAILTAS